MKAVIFLIGLLLGIVGLGLVRLAAMPPDPVTHYHANFAVFIDGKRVDLSDTRYMEDVARCKADPMLMDPEDRVHLHNRNQDVVHVHAPAATWGHLFANLHMALGDSYLITDKGEQFANGNGKTFKFVLNGQPMGTVANRAIKSLDRLVISYGSESDDDVLKVQFPQVAKDADTFNHSMDPAGCGTRHEETFGDRLRKAFWFAAH